MQRKKVKLVRGAFAALVVGALGFGATQALASPVATETASYCTRQDQSLCYTYCEQEYGPEYRARCTKDPFGFIECECYLV